MALIGSFAPPQFDGEPDQFSFCGDLFEVPGLTALPMTRFAWNMQRLEGATKLAERNLTAAKARRDLIASRVPVDETALEAAQADVDRYAVEIDFYDREGMASMYQMLMDSIGQDQWPRFEELAIRYRADEDTLMRIIVAIMTSGSRRPTQRSSDSSDGPTTNGAGSLGGSSSLVEPPGPMTPADAARLEIRAAMQPVSVSPYSG